MSLSMVVNWAQRRLVSMKAPVFFFFFFLAKVGEKQLSGEGGSLSRGKRSRTPAVFISCHWSAIQLPCNSYTYCHFHVLKINTNARNWSQRSTFLVKMYFHPAILMRMDVCQGFRQCVGTAMRHICPFRFADINTSCYFLLLASLRGYHRCSPFHHRRCTGEWSCKV